VRVTRTSSPRRSHRRRLSAVLGTSLALALPLAVVDGVQSGAAPAAPSAASAVEPTSPLSLVVPGKAIAYPQGRNSSRAYVDFGLYLQANGEPFELWSTRPTYDDQIRTEWRSTAHGTVVLPTVMSTFSGLNKFIRVRIKNGDNKTVADINPRVCLSSGFFQAPVRTSPDAPAVSPYPVGCPYNPFTLGSVQGIQQGWAVSLLTRSVKGVRKGDGPFKVIAEIAPKYADLFGITPADGKRVYKLAFGSFGERSGSDPEPLATPHASEPAVPVAGKAVGPLPDLRSLPPFQFSLSPKGTQLRFAATTWNGGDSPLVIDGYREEGDDHMTAYQFFFNEEGVETGHQEVGELHFHAANHQHWHFEDFARYRLLNPDMTLAVRSRKQSWCLANTDSVDLTVPGAEWKPYNTDLSSACGGESALAIREVLLSGSGDTYAQYRAGQAFSVGDLPNGKYIVSVEANPNGNLVESDTTNNVALRTIWLRGQGAERRVVVDPVGIINDNVFGPFFRRR
jgi:hypothetical protein